MSFPAFFDEVPAIRLHDALAQTLGSTSDGMLEYRFVDAVRVAGHSCPTVAGAWLAAVKGLQALYPPGETPERGGVEVELATAEDEGVTGVIGQVLTLVTGAAHKNGFHGLAGQHVRRDLLHYGQADVKGVRLRRKDDGSTVEVEVDAHQVHGDPAQRILLGKILQGQASPEECRRFGELWQDRVRRLLLEHADDPQVVKVRKIA